MCPELVIIVNIQYHCAGEFLGSEGLDFAAEFNLVLAGLSRQSIPDATSTLSSLKHCQSQNQEEPKKEDLS